MLKKGLLSIVDMFESSSWAGLNVDIRLEYPPMACHAAILVSIFPRLLECIES